MNFNKIRSIKYLLLAINIIAIMFIAIVVKETSITICNLSLATDFLFSTQAIPANPTNDLYLITLLSFLLLLNFLLRQFILTNDLKKIYLTIFFDTIIAIFIIITEDFNNNGIILWVIANVVYYIESPKKYITLGLGIILYIFTNYGLISIYKQVYSIQKYFLLYPPTLQKIMIIIYYALSALNLILFIIFCVLVIQEQKGIIKEKNELYNKLSKANKELLELSEIKEKMGETRERNRIAREIHDTIGHSLMAISVGVDATMTLLENDSNEAKNQLNAVSEVAKEGIQDIRRSVSALRPDSIGAHRLTQQIFHLIDKTEKTTGIKFNIDCEESLEFEEDEENAIFRVVQESITNAIKHGEASLIYITIKKEENNLIIIIHDNGIGCTHMVKGFGTTHIEERIQMLKGKVEYKSKNGFTVKAIIPIRREA